MMRCRAPRRSLAWVVALALQVAPLAARTVPATGTLTGVIRSSDGTPLIEARVYAVNPVSGDVIVSEPTDDTGRFVLTGLVGGTHEFAVSAGGTLYLVARSIHVVPGLSREVEIAVGAAEDTDGKPASAPGGLPLSWGKNPLFAGFLVFGAAVLVGASVERLTDESSATPTGGGN